MSVITAELVAKTIAGISQIGYAQRALQEAGYTATIAANRLTVDKLLEANLVLSNGCGWWQVYAIDGKPPVWTVGAFSQAISNWLGAD
jgi:hypothetical protein